MGVEHFASVRDHLRPGGLFVQWLPLFQLTEPVFEEILATAQAVFGEVHLFRENHDPSAPLVALVAGGPGTAFGLTDSDLRVLEFRIGRTSRLAGLATLEPSNHDNRLRRATESGGLWPGQPARSDAMTDFRWTSWLDRAFRADPPASDPTLHSLGPEGMRYAVGGVLRQYAVFATLSGNQHLGDSLEAQARALVSRVD